MDAFFTWAAAQYELVRERRCPLRSAVGYAVRQREPLMRVLEDGRLRLENDRYERGLRRIATGRKLWLFCGSDDHAESAAGLFSVIASARLHQFDPAELALEVGPLTVPPPLDLSPSADVL